MTPTIYQIYFNVDQLPLLDPDAIAWNNTVNDNSQLREYPVFKKIHNQITDKLWGAISPRFSQKTNITVSKFKNWIENNPGYDVYFINPCTILDSLYENVWIQGERHHPGMVNLTNTLLNRIGIDIKVEKLLMDDTTFTFCNYFVATEDFWNRYISFVDSVLHAAEDDIEWSIQLYSSKANYSRDHTLSFYPFLVERLFSTFLCLNPNIKRLNYQFCAEEMQKKVNSDQFKIITELTNMKRSAANLDGSVKDLPKLVSWQQERIKFHRNHPHLYYTE